MRPRRGLALLALLLLLLAQLLLLHTASARSGVPDVSARLLSDIKRFKRALASGPNAATSYNLATALLSLGNSSAALPHLLDAMADPSFPGTHGIYISPAHTVPPAARRHACSVVTPARRCHDERGRVPRAPGPRARQQPRVRAALPPVYYCNI